MGSVKIEQDKVNLGERTVIKRINRFLGEKGYRLLKNRRTRGSNPRKRTQREIDLGTYYVVDGKRVIEKHVDLEAFARKHEIIASYEVLADPGRG
jgi:hypothetical protein